MDPQVTYFILNYNPNGSDKITPKFIQCVESLYANTDPTISKEVIVIDQGSPESERVVIEDLRKKFGFTSVLLPRNIGISAAINLGFRMGRGRVLCLVTYDVVVTRGLDKSCLSLINDNQNVWQVVPLSDVGDNPRQSLRLLAPFGSPDVEKLLPGGVEEAALVELTINFFSRKCIERIGYFDERWMACYENMDYTFRIMLDGGKTVINRGAFAWHHHNTSSKYVGRNHFYDGMYEGDPFADGRINNLWLTKWGNQVNNDMRFDSWRLPAPELIRKYKANYPGNVYLGREQ